MVSTVEVKISASQPQKALQPWFAFKDSPSSLRIIDLPKKCGDWEITGVQVQVLYPNNQTISKDAVRKGSVWVATIDGCETAGKVIQGYQITASGKDENDNPVEGFVLGCGDVFIMETTNDIKALVGKTAVRYLDDIPDTPVEGDMVLFNGTMRFYTGSEWVDFGGGSTGDIVTEEEFNEYKEEVSTSLSVIDSSLSVLSASVSSFGEDLAAVNASVSSLASQVTRLSSSMTSLASTKRDYTDKSWKYTKATDPVMYGVQKFFLTRDEDGQESHSYDLTDFDETTKVWSEYEAPITIKAYTPTLYAVIDGNNPHTFEDDDEIERQGWPFYRINDSDTSFTVYGGGANIEYHITLTRRSDDSFSMQSDVDSKRDYDDITWDYPMDADNDMFGVGYFTVDTGTQAYLREFSNVIDADENIWKTWSSIGTNGWKIDTLDGHHYNLYRITSGTSTKIGEFTRTSDTNLRWDVSIGSSSEVLVRAFRREPGTLAVYQPNVNDATQRYLMFGQSSSIAGVVICDDVSAKANSFIKVDEMMITGPNYTSSRGVQMRGVRDVDNHLKVNGSAIAFVNEIESATSQLTSEIETVTASVSALGSSVSGLTSSVSAMTSTIDLTNSHVSALESRIGEVNASVEALGSSVSALGSSIETMGSLVSELASSVIALGSSVSALTSSIADKRDYHDLTVQNQIDMPPYYNVLNFVDSWGYGSTTYSQFMLTSEGAWQWYNSNPSQGNVQTSDGENFVFYKQGESVAEFTMDDIKNGEISYSTGYVLKANWGRGYRSFKFIIDGSGVEWVLDQFTITPDADQYGNTILRWADKSNQWFVQQTFSKGTSAINGSQYQLRRGTAQDNAIVGNFTDTSVVTKDTNWDETWTFTYEGTTYTTRFLIEGARNWDSIALKSDLDVVSASVSTLVSSVSANTGAISAITSSLSNYATTSALGVVTASVSAMESSISTLGSSVSALASSMSNKRDYLDLTYSYSSTSTVMQSILDPLYKYTYDWEYNRGSWDRNPWGITAMTITFPSEFVSNMQQELEDFGMSLPEGYSALPSTYDLEWVEDENVGEYRWMPTGSIVSPDGSTWKEYFMSAAGDCFKINTNGIVEGAETWQYTPLAIITGMSWTLEGFDIMGGELSADITINGTRCEDKEYEDGYPVGASNFYNISAEPTNFTMTWFDPYTGDAITGSATITPIMPTSTSTVTVSDSLALQGAVNASVSALSSSISAVAGSLNVSGIGCSTIVLSGTYSDSTSFAYNFVIQPSA